VTFPAEKIGFLAEAEVLLPGIGLGQQGRVVRAVGQMAGAAVSLFHGRMNCLTGEPPAHVTAETESRNLSPEEFARSRRVGLVTAGTAFSFHGSVSEGVGGELIVTFTADPVDTPGQRPPLGGVLVAGPAIPFREGDMLLGIKKSRPG
jgi:hypothetical protein